MKRFICYILLNSIVACIFAQNVQTNDLRTDSINSTVSTTINETNVDKNDSVIGDSLLSPKEPIVTSAQIPVISYSQHPALYTIAGLPVEFCSPF